MSHKKTELAQPQEVALMFHLSCNWRRAFMKALALRLWSSESGGSIDELGETASCADGDTLSFPTIMHLPQSSELRPVPNLQQSAVLGVLA